MSLPPYPRVHFRAGDLLPDLLSRAEADEDGTPSERTLAIAVDRDLHRYYYLLRLALPTFTESEASLIVDALNGVMTEPHTAGLLWAQVDDFARDGGMTKWGVDGRALVERLRALSPFAQLAIADAVERAWHLLGTGADLADVLRSVGLVR